MDWIDSAELKENLPDFLVDVRLSDEYDACHIEGALSNCVFEVQFVERMSNRCGDRSATVVVYGQHADVKEAEMAAEKLKRAGYSSVRILRGGIDAWKASGLETIDGDKSQDPDIPQGTFALDLEASAVEWTGRNLLSKHFGTVGIQSGEVEIREGMIESGSVVIDMNSIDCRDLDGEMKETLIAHLKSDDFFDTDRFPTATFRIDSAERIENSGASRQNLILRGELEMKGKTAPVELAATAGVTPEGKAAAQASFVIDRTVWNVIYGSTRFFSRLGQHLVNDFVDIDVKVVTR